MKAIINFSKRTNWFKALGALITCLLFLIPPACEKLDPNQDSLPDMDEMVATPRAANSSVKTYMERYYGFGENGGTIQEGDPIQRDPQFYELFSNFVLKVQNMSGNEQISNLEIRINDVLVVTASDLKRDFYVAKPIRNLSNPASFSLRMTGEAWSQIRIWIEGTFKGLSTAYGKHFYYKSVKNMDFWSANSYCRGFGGHLVKIDNAKENTFAWNLYKTDGWYFLGLSDIDQNNVWKWADGTLCRVVNWNWSQCPDGPTQGGGWGDYCRVIQDYGYNNWSDGEPNNCGNNCSEQNVAVFNNDGTWDDVYVEQGNFVIEWDYIPTSAVINQLFEEEFL